MAETMIQATYSLVAEEIIWGQVKPWWFYVNILGIRSVLNQLIHLVGTWREGGSCSRPIISISVDAKLDLMGFVPYKSVEHPGSWAIPLYAKKQNCLLVTKKFVLSFFCLQKKKAVLAKGLNLPQNLLGIQMCGRM